MITWLKLTSRALHQKLAELDWIWSFLKFGQSFRENWMFWLTPSGNFSLEIELNVANLWKFSKDHYIKSVQRWSFFWSVFSCIQRYSTSLRIQSERGKIRTRKNSVFRHFPCSGSYFHRWFWGIQISYLRYVNYLQSGLHWDKYRNSAERIFQMWSLTLDLIQRSTIRTYKSQHSYLSV